LTALNHSADFTCPHCEAGAFEVLAMDRHLTDEQHTDCALVMRCLQCLDFFWHWVETESFSDQAITVVPATVGGPSQQTH
jgi:hypothetical protein